jgi:cell division protein FtsL
MAGRAAAAPARASARPRPARKGATRTRASRPTRSASPARRASGPAGGVVRGGAVALPRLLLPGSSPRARLAGVLDALLSGRGWIALVGVLLAGIVFFNVDLLQLNREITRTAERSSQLKRENARLRLELARLASSERIQTAAQRRGLFLPPPGHVGFLRSSLALDSRRAASRITEPGKAPVPATQPATPPAATTPPTATAPPAATQPPTVPAPTAPAAPTPAPAPGAPQQAPLAAQPGPAAPDG